MLLTKWTVGRVSRGVGLKGILLTSTRGNNQTLSLSQEPDGTILFLEECDGYFGVQMSKDDAIRALREAIEWIEESRFIAPF